MIYRFAQTRSLETPAMSFLSRPLLLAGSLAFPILGILFFLPLPSPPQTPPAPPRLAVLVVFDQLRGDYLERWDDLYGKDGFHRLEREGAWFQNCHYPYASTLTGCGHASLATGCSPDINGIITNDWLEGDKLVNCVSDPEGRCERVPPVPPKETIVKETDSTEETRYPVAPTRLRAPTIGEAVKIATGGKGHVVSLSFKDRGAVLPAGQNKDAVCYWLDKDGTFVTSTYYDTGYRPWARAMNEHRDEYVDRWFGKQWDRLRSDVNYPERSQEDDKVRKKWDETQGMSFPHPFDGGEKKLKSKYYGQLYTSPQGNELLLELVKKAVEGENLGHHGTPDLLCVSFSSNDAVGHKWGPDSQEVLDTTLRTDEIVRDLLAFLDKQVGHNRYTLVLSADHGVCPLPESKTGAAGAGIADARHSVKELRAAAEAHLAEKFAVAPGTRFLAGKEGIAYPWLYLKQEVLKANNLDPIEVENELASWLKTQPGIETAFTRKELANREPTTDKFLRMLRRAYNPEVSGQVGIVVKPYHIFFGTTGTTHGSPHFYDTQVPLLVFGPGVKPGIYRERVEPLSAAPILARALGIPPPAKATAEVPGGLFETR
jgi:Type I phosphodiesterase / nucleotide pyrophosphatase